MGEKNAERREQAPAKSFRKQPQKKLQLMGLCVQLKKKPLINTVEPEINDKMVTFKNNLALGKVPDLKKKFTP